MPVYAIDKSFTASTTELTAETQTIPVNVGIIKQLNLNFPSGCINLVHVRIFYRGRQILPRNSDREFRGDDRDLQLMNIDEEIFDQPGVLVVSGWNEDSNAHRIVGELVIETKERGS